MVGSAIQQLGLNFESLQKYKSREILGKLEAAKYKVLKIDWKSISVFPEEAKRFK